MHGARTFRVAVARSACALHAARPLGPAPRLASALRQLATVAVFPSRVGHQTGRAGTCSGGPLRVLGHNGGVGGSAAAGFHSSCAAAGAQSQKLASPAFDAEAAADSVAAAAQAAAASLLVQDGAVRRIMTLQAQAAAGAGSDASAVPPLLRVAVKPGGCGGFEYSFDLDSGAPAEDDTVVPAASGHPVVVVDSVSLDKVRGSTLEWYVDLMGERFRIVDNPQAESSCGCKSSFAPKSE
jgi:iron-sulfur cluster assembly accessory protein